MQQFTVPREIYYGYGAIDSLASVRANRAMVVSDKIMERLGWVNKVKQILGDNGTDVIVFTEVKPDPSRALVAKGLDIMRDFEPDLVVGIGGGSPIDAGKAMWVFYELPEMTWEQACVPFSLPRLRTKARFVAIPSTSGTGTEVGIGTVITDTASVPAVKKSIDSFEITPDVAILDPQLTLSMPPDITANTGMDVIVHAMEAYVANGANEISDSLAMRSMELAFEWLPKAVQSGDDERAREKMHMASAVAGMAFNNAGLGITHSLAHLLGSVWGVPHGRANAVLLPYVIAFNAKVADHRYANIAVALGLEGENNDQLVRALIRRLLCLMDSIAMPAAIKDLGIDEDDFNKSLDSLVVNALEDACTGDNPGEVTADQLKGIYLSAWAGEFPKVGGGKV